MKRIDYSIDKSDMYSTLANTTDDFQKAVSDYHAIKVKIDAQNIENIVLCGMGGSAIAGELIASIFNSGIYSAKKVPFVVNRSYDLPNFVTEKTLVILSSYSGNTEETLSVAAQAHNLTKQIICISAGGQLTAFAKEHQYDLITMPLGYQPRCAFYFPAVALLFLLKNMGLMVSDEICEDNLNAIAYNMKFMLNNFEKGNELSNNSVFLLVEQLRQQTIVLYAADGIFNVISLRIQQQIQENAKNQIFRNVLPEMNHNEINSWEFPAEQMENRIVVLLRSKHHENPRVALRFTALNDVLNDSNIATIPVKIETESILDEIFNMIYFWDWISYYLALENGIDPTDIPKILFLKDFLAKHGKE